jgi:hypothetical protein
MMQTNNAAAAATIVKEKLRGIGAYAEKTIQEGSITTTAIVYALTSTSGNKWIELFLIRYDARTDTYLMNFHGSAPPDQWSIDNGLNSATFSATITGLDFVTDEEMTFTVSADLTVTGKVEPINTGDRTDTPNFTIVTNFIGVNKPAGGSLNITGEDVTFSTDDATGAIGKFRSGQIVVSKP